MAKVKRKGKRQRTTSERIWLIVSVILAVSMVASLFIGFFGAGTGPAF